jgi:hypothetical protein
MSFFQYALFGIGITAIILLCVLFANVTKIPWKQQDEREGRDQNDIADG